MALSYGTISSVCHLWFGRDISGITPSFFSGASDVTSNSSKTLLSLLAGFYVFFACLRGDMSTMVGGVKWHPDRSAVTCLRLAGSKNIGGNEKAEGYEAAVGSGRIFSTPAGVTYAPDGIVCIMPYTDRRAEKTAMVSSFLLLAFYETNVPARGWPANSHPAPPPADGRREEGSLCWLV